MRTSIVLGVLGLVMLGSAVFVNSVFASRERVAGQFGPNYSPERHAQMNEAFATGDYDAWKDLMGDRGAARVVTQENFAQFTQMHNLMLQGKTDEANKIRQEIGLGNGQGRGMMGGKNRGQNRGENFIDRDGDGNCDRMN